MKLLYEASVLAALLFWNNGCVVALRLGDAPGDDSWTDAATADDAGTARESPTAAASAPSTLVEHASSEASAAAASRLSQPSLRDGAATVQSLVDRIAGKTVTLKISGQGEGATEEEATANAEKALKQNEKAELQKARASLGGSLHGAPEDRTERTASPAPQSGASEEGAQTTAEAAAEETVGGSSSNEVAASDAASASAEPVPAGHYEKMKQALKAMSSRVTAEKAKERAEVAAKDREIKEKNAEIESLKRRDLYHPMTMEGAIFLVTGIALVCLTGGLWYGQQKTTERFEAERQGKRQRRGDSEEGEEDDYEEKASEDVDAGVDETKAPKEVAVTLQLKDLDFEALHRNEDAALQDFVRKAKADIVRVLRARTSLPPVERSAVFLELPKEGTSGGDVKVVVYMPHNINEAKVMKSLIGMKKVLAATIDDAAAETIGKETASGRTSRMPACCVM
eukprot:TRINITY_DN30745_c0_g1_i1.p1 TRINITY_DN30745_c0_g1~~TRINITY_DN30745_c0_g1_i1.p1  ORF type:complete len:455 (-),score=155.54 TRINITY_DN30745_c0_g1_i1:87-1451(-)